MIAIGCDHGAFDLKNTIVEYFKEKGIPYKDFGIYEEKDFNFTYC